MLKDLLRRTLERVGSAVGQICPVCGRRAFRARPTKAITPPLATAWGIGPRWVSHFDRRESTRCRACLATARDRSLARALLRFAAGRDIAARSVPALCTDAGFRTLAVAEINAAGCLHPALSVLPGLAYSEYGSTDPKVPHEDLERLSYPDGSFELVISTEVLEHVPDLSRALAEIRRVLRPGGTHVFTVPVVWDWPRTRYPVKEGRPPSYHGDGTPRDGFLVHAEFGADFPHLVEAEGFRVTVLRMHNPADIAVLAVRV